MFVEKLPSAVQGPENEKYAYMHSSEFKNIYAMPMHELSSHGIEGYLSITNSKNGRKIYRKYYGWSHIEESTVGLGYRSLCELGITNKQLLDEPPVVDVKKAHWFCYYWHNSDSGVRAPFRIAVIGGILTAISLALQLIF